MTRPSVPPGLIDALDCALETGVRMRPEHIAGVLDWLHGVIAMNTDHHVALSVDEMVLVAHALGDAIGAPIAEIDTKHVRDMPAVLPQLLRIKDSDNLIPELTTALRNKGFMELFKKEDRQVFSPCGTYRYELERFIGDGPPVLFCGLNPSVAGQKVTKDDNDPTVRKWVGFAQRWGCGSILVVNAYGFIETKSAKLAHAVKAGVDIVGPENDWYIRAAIERVRALGGKIVVCWGGKISPARQAEISYVFGDAAMCLGVNGDGTPEHALYIPYARELVRWSCP